MVRTGGCFCGAIHFRIKGEPEAMGYCHCESCRSWSASPLNTFGLWKADNIQVTRGAELISQYAKTPMSERKFCKLCGGHLMTDHPPLGTTTVYCTTIAGLDFKPAIHVYYAERVLSVKDGLPKFADLPAELGGSGETLPE